MNDKYITVTQLTRYIKYKRIPYKISIRFKKISQIC